MKKFFILIALPFLVLYTSCSSIDYNETIAGPEKKFYEGDFLNAARDLLPAINKSSKSKLLFMMEAGYMLHAGGDFKKSNTVLLPAGKLARIIPTSISQHAAALLTNNAALDYKGEDFEKVLVHMYLGVNFLMLGDYESAGVEFKLVNEELDKARYSDNGKARYKQNIMAKYLTAAAYEMIGEQHNDMNDIEFAYKELEQIYALNSNIQIVREDLTRLAKRLGYDDDYSKWSSISGKRISAADQEAGEFLVIFQSGRSAVKRSRGSLLSDTSMRIAINRSLNGISLPEGVTIAAALVALETAENPIPYFEARTDQVNYLRVTVNGRTFRTTMLEDISATAIQNLQDDYTNLKLQVAASVAIKAAASVAAGIAAREITDRAGGKSGLANLLGVIAGAGTGAYLFSQMAPDLRCWHTLPAKLHVGRIFLPPGTYNATVEYIGGSGVVHVNKMNVEIKKKAKTIFNTRTLI